MRTDAVLMMVEIDIVLGAKVRIWVMVWFDRFKVLDSRWDAPSSAGPGVGAD